VLDTSEISLPKETGTPLRDLFLQVGSNRRVQTETLGLWMGVRSPAVFASGIRIAGTNG
jgi:hypothetical protein